MNNSTFSHDVLNPAPPGASRDVTTRWDGEFTDYVGFELLNASLRLRPPDRGNSLLYVRSHSFGHYSELMATSECWNIRSTGESGSAPCLPQRSSTTPASQLMLHQTACQSHLPPATQERQSPVPSRDSLLTPAALNITNRIAERQFRLRLPVRTFSLFIPQQVRVFSFST